MANNGEGVLAEAIEALRRLSGMEVTHDPALGTLTLDQKDRRATFHVQTVTSLTKAKQAELIRGSDHEARVLVVRTLTTEQARQLREAGLNYVDAAGNAHLKAEGAVVFIEGQKTALTVPAVQSAGRAFQPAGLKVLFALLVAPVRVNETYRDLAARVDVSPATVKHALDDLERRGNVVKTGRGRGMRRRLIGVPDLAKRWANSYGDVLRPKLLRGRYGFLDANQQRDWKRMEMNPKTSCWSGEPAADLYEGMLRPEVLTLYTTTRTADLARTLRIVPDPQGAIEVLDKFWTEDVEVIDGHPAAPRLLAYADLLASGATRNLEAAPLLLPFLLNAWTDTTDTQQ